MVNTTDNNEDSWDEDHDYGPSKTQRKKEAEALQALGQRLTKLKQDELSQISLPDSLAKAIAEFGRIHSNEAKRRHLQYIGELMKDVDEADITRQLERFTEGSQHQITLHHETEQWRTSLLEDGKTALTEFANQYPESDIQHLRHLIRNARKDVEQQKNRGAAKKLYRHLREVIDTDDDKTP